MSNIGLMFGLQTRNKKTFYMSTSKLILYIFLFTNYFTFSQTLEGKRYAIQTRTVESALEILKDSTKSIESTEKSVLGYIDIYRFEGKSLSVYRNQKGDATSFQLFQSNRQIEYNGKGRPMDNKTPNYSNEKIKNTDTLIAFLSKTRDEESMNTIQISTSYWYLSQNSAFNELQHISGEKLLLGNIYPDCIAVGHPKALFVAMKASSIENKEVQEELLTELLEKPKRRKCKKLLKIL